MLETRLAGIGEVRVSQIAVLVAINVTVRRQRDASIHADAEQLSVRQLALKYEMTTRNIEFILARGPEQASAGQSSLNVLTPAARIATSSLSLPIRPNPMIVPERTAIGIVNTKTFGNSASETL